MKNLRLLSVFIVSTLVAAMGLWFLAGFTTATPAGGFQLYLYSLVAGFLVTVIAWIFEQKEHPPGLRLLFFTEMWERFSYYGMRGLLILYLTKSYIEGGLGFSDSQAGLIYGTYTGLVYLTPIIGGWLADNFIGQRRAITIGGLLMAAGQFALAAKGLLGLESIGDAGFYLGLLLLIIGNGFFKPNISIVVGKLYQNTDPRKDAAFNIFYMGINLGAFLAPLVCGFLAEDFFAQRSEDGTSIARYGFEYGFLAAGLGMLAGQIMYNLLGNKYLGNVGVEPEAKKTAREAKEAGNTVSNAPLTKEEKDRTAVIFILVAFVTFFWAGFEQAGGALSIYTDKYINRTVSDFLIPTSWFQSVNPLFIVLLAPLFTMLWLKLAAKNKEPNTPVKMGLGMILLGLGFMLMVGAIFERGGDIPDENIKANIMWLLGTYLIHTCGELCLSPVGLSMVTKMAPVKLASMLMGIWFLSSFIANQLAGLTLSVIDSMGALAVFSGIGVGVALLGLVLILVNKKIIAMMHGIR